MRERLLGYWALSWVGLISNIIALPIIALIISNSGLSELYFSTLNQYLFIGINNFGLKLSVLHWINDALMAIFFFFVTLEIKREFLQGELSNICLLYTSPSPRDGLLSRMPSSA